jgi:hypothetical protein
MAEAAHGVLIAMNEDPRRARSCRCDHPVLDGESCLRCGRSLIFLPEPRSAPPAQPSEWTRAGVIRAIRAFAFFRGRPPVDEDWAGRTAENWPAHETVVRLFGSVYDAVQLAGRSR